MAKVVGSNLNDTYTTTGYYEYAQPLIYDDTYADHDEATIKSHFRDDDGGMAESMANDIPELQKAAKATIKTRKPIIDWKTSNQSFINVHNDLKRLGIKHNTFFLKLYDRELVGINPYDPMLPLEMQVRVYVECVINPWYFLREIARIPADGLPIEPGSGIQYELDRNNLAAWYCFINHIDCYTSKPRQCGKTQDALLKINYAYHFGSSSATILFFNKDLGLSKENLARLKDQRDLFPVYLQMRTAFNEDGSIIKGIDNITTMKNPVTSCQVKVMPCANSKEMATRLGRGYTAALNVFDEFDYTNFNTEIVNAAVFAYSTASKNAIQNGSCSCRLFMSTPGDLATRDGLNATNFIRGTKETKGMYVWSDSYYDVPLERVKKEIYSPNYNGIVFIEHDWKQLKRGMDWYERQCNLASYNQEVILREILLQRLNGSSMSPFTRDQQLYMASHKRPPIDTIDITAEDTMFQIQIYEKFYRKIPYIISIDPAPGLGEDNNAVVMINPRTRKIAAEFKTPYISSDMLSATITQFMDRYCPNALIVVEANRGHDLMRFFSKTHYAQRIWYDPDRLNQLLTVHVDKYGGMPQSVITRKVQGFVTGVKSRNLLFQLLEELANESIDLLCTEQLVNELLTLIRKPGSGRIEAAPQQHDDVVMAYLIGMYVLLNASNLEQFGIRRWERDMPDENEKRQESQKEYRDRMQSMLPQIDPRYRGIFEDYLKEADPLQVTERYIQQVRASEAAAAAHPYFQFGRDVDIDTEGFDAEASGSYFGAHPMEIGDYQKRTGGVDFHGGLNIADTTPMDGSDDMPLSQGERDLFEQQIFQMNYPQQRPQGLSSLSPYGDSDPYGFYNGGGDGPAPFNPGDWVR